MTPPGLRALFAAQLARQALTLRMQLAQLNAGAPVSEAELALPLHLLKGAALAAGETALATRCHAAESALIAGDAPTLQASLAALLHDLVLEAPAVAISLADLKLALRSGFAALLQRAGGEATLQLHLSADVLPHADVLLDLLPLLLANALAHGSEPAALRQAAGKPAPLRVRVRARADGAGRFHLLVADDGRGGPRPHKLPADLLSGRGWGVAAVRARVAALADGRLAYRGRAGRGSVVRIGWGGRG